MNINGAALFRGEWNVFAVNRSRLLSVSEKEKHPKLKTSNVNVDSIIMIMAHPAQALTPTFRGCGFRRAKRFSNLIQ